MKRTVHWYAMCALLPHLRGRVQNAVWAGNMEVQATSKYFGCNVCIYQQGQPCWRTIIFTPIESFSCLHLSYHDGDHYNSVCLRDDLGTGPPINLADCVVAQALEGADEVWRRTPA